MLLPITWNLHENEFFFVILNEVKNLAPNRDEILHFVQNDKKQILFLFLKREGRKNIN